MKKEKIIDEKVIGLKDLEEVKESYNPFNLNLNKRELGYVKMVFAVVFILTVATGIAIISI